VIRLAVTALAASMALIAARAVADDLSHVSDAELAAELSAREQDIARTTERVQSLTEREGGDVAALDTARMEVLEIDRSLAERAGFLYRFGRRGAAFRYLLGAPSASELIRRYATLRRLVVALLEVRRSAGVRLAETEAALEKTRAERQMARVMLSQLEEARAELEQELSLRSQSTLAWR
jgi:hypothetical protein